MPDTKLSNESCDLIDYGIHSDVVDALFKSIVWWLEGKDLPWTQTKYVNVFVGPLGRTVVELLFFHYDGPTEREVGGGGEYNHCKLYLYDDRCNIAFVGDNTDTLCGITFKYSTLWKDTNVMLLRFIHDYLNDYMSKIFESEPNRFNGMDVEIEAIKPIVVTIAEILVHKT